MRKKLLLENWNRRDHYEFFKTFDESFFGVTVDIQCTEAYEYCKSKGHSFFLYYLHCAIVAANGIDEFRYRIEDDEVVVYSEIAASSTIDRPDGTFGFSYMKYAADFVKFEEMAKLEVQRVKAGSGLEATLSGQDVIHFTVLPWFKFTSFSHARSYQRSDSCPKIAFGKMTEVDGKRVMPMSIHVHHALMDGYHVGQFVEQFETLLERSHS